MTFSQPPKTKSDDGPVKRRACDECRTRKLACSKEPDGCSRCRREGLKCVYSPQKPMGRPRKRRLCEKSEDQTTASVDTTHGASEESTTTKFQVPVPSTDPSTEPGSTILERETDFSWYNGRGNGNGSPDVLSSSLFLDTHSPGNERIKPSTLPLDFSTDPDMMFGESSFPADGFEFQPGGGNILNGINFEAHPADKQVSFQDINDDFAGILSSEALQTTSSSATAPLSVGMDDAGDTSAVPLDPLSTIQGYGHGDFPGESWSTSETPPSETSLQTPRSDTVPVHNHKALPQTSCACLSQIYLSLDSLSRLPEDVGLAMAVARAAARAAHDVVACPACSKPFTDDATIPLPIQSFQNMMMLGALIPTTVNAYIKILELVDEATSQANEKGEKMVFRFTDYGGLWGRLGDMDKVSPRSTVEMYDNRVMEPDQWRHTVRAVLKVDLYGFRVDGRTGADGSVVSHTHPGLRDVVTAMEDRSNCRHDNVDALVAAGRHPACSQSHYPMTPRHDRDKKSERPCLRIVEMARLSLEKLAIS
ncbi:hypothetical protein ACRALDRAFT_2053554 [Sodiomyces alcalophilus JCM 7366]|uniref:uncharacterized protein n=1 Tax=Sodiomyces alcalophilus JCM 7366 TaxID=591952 RepID=UPI0039B4A687